MERKTNWLAIVVSVVVTMLIGFLWYGFLFSEQWMAGNGITMEGAAGSEKMFKNGVEIPMTFTPMLVNIVGMVINALVMNWLLVKMNVSTWQTGATVGAAIGLLMVLGVLTGNMFANNPMSLTMIDGSYSFLLFVIIGAIVGGWQKK
ncbi:MAG TPA: DUF1761 domain-containing protein [Saprospiraceae bacterium]|nr:DUF1761 domain-containing protein [Saprospiraceae bacterium]